MGVYAFAFLGSRPIAATINGSVSDLTSHPSPLQWWPPSC